MRLFSPCLLHYGWFCSILLHPTANDEILRHSKPTPWLRKSDPLAVLECVLMRSNYSEKIIVAMVLENEVDSYVAGS
jgi:hypothetical protein